MMVVIILTARPSWAKLEPVCRALRRRGTAFGIIACGSALLERYGYVVGLVKAQGYPVMEELWTTVEGTQLVTSVSETAALTAQLGQVLSRVRPSVVCVCADRHEVLGAAIAAGYLHIPLVHLQGGERSGSIDDRVRDSITMLASQHCVATQRAHYRVYGLTGDWHAIHLTGCPSVDLAQEALHDTPLLSTDELGGSGPPISLRRPFLVVLQHPVTTEVEAAGDQMDATLQAISRVRIPRLLLWPGEEAGGDVMSRRIRAWRHQHPQETLFTFKSLPPLRFLRLLSQAACLVGNSSVGIRECSLLGTPVVNIGTRQRGRERTAAVVDVGYTPDAIHDGIEKQLVQGPSLQSTLYGGGDAGERIAELLWQMC
jgi:UDP-hydrolysing UDP-N-acetyl-D-glucosamine 2-epimerase